MPYHLFPGKGMVKFSSRVRFLSEIKKPKHTKQYPQPKPGFECCHCKKGNHNCCISLRCSCIHDVDFKTQSYRKRHENVGDTSTYRDDPALWKGSNKDSVPQSVGC